MKVFTTIFAILVVFQTATFTAKKSNTDKRTITVSIDNVPSDKGTVSYVLYNKDSFMIVPDKTQSSYQKGKKSKVVFKNTM